MKWYVIFDNWNARKIAPYNIFDHDAFHKEVVDLLEKCDDKETFARKLNASLKYYFWAQAEWEVVVVPWIISTAEKELKIDAYSQVRMNWAIFLEYVWSHKEKKSGDKT